MSNKVTLAAAGAGKTQHIVKSAYHCDGQVLITTFTDENTEEIKSRFYRLYGAIPSNITVLPWFTFLLRYLIKPFQNIFIPQRIKGVLMVSNQSTRYISKTSVNYYLATDNKIYSDKIGSLAMKFIEDYKQFPLMNLSQIFNHIYIDEMQDMGGNDLDVAGILLKSAIHVEGVCDPRQTTYLTNNGSKNKSKRGIKIEDFLIENRICLDKTSLNTNHRCHKDIVNLSNKLYPDFPSTKCDSYYTEEHLGVYVIRPSDIDEYKDVIGKRFRIQELRYSKTETKRYPSFNGRNIGDVKGRTYNRTILYLPSTHLDWLCKDKEMPKGKSKSLLYVGLTRARLSTAIVYDYDDDFNHSIIQKFK